MRMPWQKDVVPVEKPTEDASKLEANEPSSEGEQVLLAEKDDEETEFLSGVKLYLIVIGLAISVLLVALDNAILATAIPTITTKFNSLGDVGWYGSAFLITICACQPLGGKIFQYFSLKWAYLMFVGVFEIGSLVCATAQSSTALILGRAVAGIGAAGLFSGALVIIAHTIPLRLRPIYTGVIASMFGVGNIVGPLLGGVLTQHVSWRWCFYINLPCGAVTVFLLAVFFKPPVRKATNVPLGQKIKHLDLPGFALFTPAVIMLLLALQWGGNKYPWKSATVIGLICGFAGMIALFAVWQVRQQAEALIPPKIFTQRSVLFGSMIGCFAFGTLQLVTYWLPIWFQVIKGSSPTKSGVMNLPSILANIIMSIFAGGLVTKLGWYNPFLLGGTILLTIGAGLFTTFQTDSGHAKWIGYQVVYGAGIGSIIQMPLVAVQAVLPLAEVATGTAIIVFFQFFGGSIFLAIGQNIFESHLLKALVANVPSENAEMIIMAGAEAVRRIVRPEHLQAVLSAYNKAITDNFYLGVAGGIVAFGAACCMEWVSVKGRSLI